MVLINELTVEQINAALLHLQRSKDEVVGGNKGTTIQNISISNSGGGGNNVDYSGTIKNLAKLIDTNTTAIEKNKNDIANLKSKFSTIEQSVEDTLQGLVDNGISDLSFDPLTKQLTITTNDGDIYQTVIEQDIGYLSYDSATNKLILTTGNQSQEITLPYIKSSEKGSANGVATLDENGRVPYSQLPESAMEFLGQWDASTNTPHLADGTGTNGDFYIVSAGGTVDFGTAQDPHIVTFTVNDRVVYEGDIAQWVRLPAGQVSSVNGQSGAVTLTANDIEYSTGVSIKAKIDANAVQSDWNVTDTTSLAYIKNKPTIPASPVQSDWNVTDTTSLAYIKNKPTIPSNIVGIEDKGNNAWYPVALCTGTSCVGKSSGYCFIFNPGIGYMEFYGLSLGRGCCTESAGLIQAHGTCSINNMICFLNNTGDANGNGVSIGGGGVVIIGAGESSNEVWRGINGNTNLYGANAGSEVLHLASDGAICFHPNVNLGWSNRKTMYLDTSGVLHACCFCGPANWVKGDTMRPANSNLYPKSSNGSLTHFLATSSMTTGKPSADGHIVQMSWDNAGGYGAQLFLGNSANVVPQYRSENGGTWTSWHNFITDENISTQHVACADSTASTNSVKDRKNNTETYLAYGCASLTTNPSYLAAWNGYELRAIQPACVCVGQTYYACVASRAQDGYTRRTYFSSRISEVACGLFLVDIRGCGMRQCSLYCMFNCFFCSELGVGYLQDFGGRFETGFIGYITGRDSCSQACDIGVIYINHDELRFYNNNDSLEFTACKTATDYLSLCPFGRQIQGYFSALKIRSSN